MIEPETIQVIKTTVPVLKTHGEALTRLFYQRLFSNNPEVKSFFNQAHQQAGSQQKALAAAICAYAENIENPANLADAVELIAQKHVSLGIQAEHYPIVGQNLLATIKELLGDAATDEIIDAWAEAYQTLADILIQREKQIYDQQKKAFGWTGFKAFKVIKREQNSEVITSFYLQPEDGLTLNAHRAGQYITVRVAPDNDQQTMRNYSLSNPPGSDYYRISIKREIAREGQGPDGLVSNFLHDRINEGDTLWLAPPCGDFIMNSEGDRPLVMMAGGVGITPLLSMLHEQLDRRKQPVKLIQAAVNGDNHAFADELATLDQQHAHFDWHVRYSDPADSDRDNGRFDSEGLIDNDLIASLDKHADFYLCGPQAMMQHCHSMLTGAGVSPAKIHFEAFGPAAQIA